MKKTGLFMLVVTVAGLVLLLHWASAGFAPGGWHAAWQLSLDSPAVTKDFILLFGIFSAMAVAALPVACRIEMGG